MARKLIFKAEDEPRDAMGRWTRAMEAKGITLHGTGGLMGKSRDQVIDKIKNILDDVSGHTGGSRIARYTGAAVGALLGSAPGVPTDIMQPLMHHSAEAADQIRQTTSLVVGKTLEHPAFKALARRAIFRKKGISKSLHPEEGERLKEIVAGVMADTRMPPHVNYSDPALSAVAQGAYRHLHDRICALRDAA